MLYNPKSRRHFLTGAGHLALALPALPSLMPRPARGAPIRSPMRFVMSQSYWGQSYKYWTPKFTALDSMDAGVKKAKLTDLPGPISKVLGPAFSDVKGKMNVVYGLSVLHNYYGHQALGASCSSSMIAGPINADTRPRSKQPSIQYVMANSPKVYPGGDAGIVRHLNVYREYGSHYGGDSFRQGGDVTSKPDGYGMGNVLLNPKALYQKLAGSFNPNGGTATNPATDPFIQSRIKLVQDVYQDYKSVIDSGQLSVADRPRFEAYMTLIAEVEKNLSTPVKSCADPKPTLAPEGGGRDNASLDDPTNGYVAADHDCAKILAAALACQLTSVVDFNMGATAASGDIHAYQHNGSEVLHSDVMTRYARSVGYLWTEMDSLKDADGKTVLDNSIAVLTNGDGLCGLYPVDTFGNSNYGAHSMMNLPIATAGSLGGRLRTGYFLDYTTSPVKRAEEFYAKSWPYNNFLVTMFQAFGLSPAEYYDTGQGYGEYDPGRCKSLPADLTSPAGRRQPLPFLLKA